MSAHHELPRRSWLVSAANRAISSLWKSRLLSPPRIEEDLLIERATAQTGLADFGDPWFRKPLGKMISALQKEAQLNPLGAFVAEKQIGKMLKDRLWAEHWFSEHPEILAQPLRAPVIVVGPMRSGTTRLHRLLAADRRFSHIRFFETVSPAPHPDFRRTAEDSRPQLAKRLLATINRANPRTAAIHPTGPFEPEEELGLLVASAWGMKHEAQWTIPSYGRWSEQQDPTPAYEHMARLLRLVSWARRDDGSQPWVLKTPQHMLDLPALLATFPDARLIFIHRDPVRVVGSACSLVWNQMTIHSDHVDGHWVGQEWLRKTQLKIDRMVAARQGIPAGQMIDVHYADMDKDWESVMAQVYAFLDVDIRPALPAMRGYIADAERRGKSRPHRYELSAFGLRQGQVRERFSSYIENFDLTQPHSAPEPEPAPLTPSALGGELLSPVKARAATR